MKKIIWSDEFSVGVNVLDEQHKVIIKLINKLLDNQNARVNSEVISDLLGEMRIYMDNHLKYEEKLLKDNGYPNLEQHVAMHNEYGEKFGELIFSVMNNNTDAPENILQYLKDWWTNHILHEDMKYRPFFERKGVI